MQITTNYELKMPELTDPADITALNTNWSSIDSELKGRRLSTVEVANANLNTLLADKSYSCAGTIRNAPIACTFCILEAFDTGAETSGTIVQMCHIPQSDYTVRSFIRSVSNGTLFGAWSELTGVATAEARLSAYIQENTFRFNALAGALVNQLTSLNVEVFDSTSSINTTTGDGSNLISFYNETLHVFNKNTDGNLTVYLTNKTVTTGNNRAWCLVDYAPVEGSTGTISVAISRDGGSTYTNTTSGVLATMSGATGVNMVVKLFISGQVVLKNFAWGVRA